MDVKKDFDNLADEYDNNLDDLLGQWGETDKWAEYKVQLLQMFLPAVLHTEKKKVLDFGCGTGRSLEYFQEYFNKADLYGCDISDASLKIARKRLESAHFFLENSPADIYDQNTKWDVVFLACVMHHIDPKERTRWLKAITDNLSEGGFLAIFEHNVNNPCTKNIILSPKNRVDRIDWMLSQKLLISLVNQTCSNMNVYWKGYTLFSPWRVKQIVHLEKYLKWLPYGAQHCVIFKKCR